MKYELVDKTRESCNTVWVLTMMKFLAICSNRQDAEGI